MQQHTSLTIASVLFLMCSVAQGGCSWSTPSEVGKYKTKVYPGARLIESDSMGEMIGDSFGNMEDYTTVFWVFESSASTDDIAKFYTDLYPEAELEVDEAGVDEDGYEYARSVSLYWYLQGPDDAEICITIYDGQIEIAETTKD